ncbi:malate synthase [Oikeobacillus pervagus]|uniref:Malate synthase n=1 Tax=Oikeobacillus pervagus TaxID=1325931 RepID=A0AAJ1T5D4_9BACI|nr:malate synthase A [Oikeobacillus pervagus]MDQ0215541.1 malate synthase [Oikeobacillus pervagus]
MTTQTAGIQIVGPMHPRYEEILTPQTLQFIEQLERRFGDRRRNLLQKRRERQRDLDNGLMPTFLEETKHIRDCDWKIAPMPADLQDRCVEIIGPVERKIVINALNSGAKCFVACFEDTTSPTWENIIEGQFNLRDAVNRTISFKDPNRKVHQLHDQIPTLMVRPRGWHLEEKNILLDGEPVSASLLDFGLFFFHNARRTVENGSGPYFYLPKLETYLEARLWNDVFVFAQKYVGIPRGTVKATVLIESIVAAFEMDEILYELKEHSAGLNCGRWDYLFSYIKKFRNHQDMILPDRSNLTMTSSFMRAYSLLTIQTCHRRKAPAIGGMAAQIPVKDNVVKNQQAFEQIRADKEREARDGYDGTWVVHPSLVPVAMEVFNREMPEANQIETKKLENVHVSETDLLALPEGKITENGVRLNIYVGIQYIASWLCGHGAVPLYGLMEDTATAEISRAQLWQWIRHQKGVLHDGRKVTRQMYNQIKQEELQRIKQDIGEEAFASGRFHEATQLFDQLILNDAFEEFLTIPGYKIL